MSMESYQVYVSLVLGGTGAVGTTQVLALSLPGTSLGGGVTVTKIAYMSQAAIAAASAPQYTLVSLDSSSNIIATIGTATASAAWTAGTVRSITVTAANAYVSGTVSYLAVKTAQTAANSAQMYVSGNIQYVLGRGDD